MSLLSRQIGCGRKLLSRCSRRKFGGHNGGSKEKELYPTFEWKHDPSFKQPYVNSPDGQAYFLGVKPGAPRQYWELPTYFFLGCAFLLTLYGVASPRETLSDWARKEAIARNAARENGEEITYGKFLTTPPSLYKDE